MSVLAKKLPTEVQVYMDGNIYKFANVPKTRVKLLLTSIKEYRQDIMPWRQALKNVLSKHGEPAAMVRGSRIKDSITQAELARRLGIPQQHISEMENGKRPIGKAMAKRLARVFRTDYRVFL